MSFPFLPQLVASLEEKHKAEFLAVVAELELGSGDLDIAKLLRALQLYKAYYEKIPHEIQLVHAEALAEIRQLRDEVSIDAERIARGREEMSQWAQLINAELTAVSPEILIKTLHNRLLDEALAATGGTIRALAASCRRTEEATRRMHAAADEAFAAIDVWQALTLRRVWASAFGVCLVVVFLAITCFWFFYLRHQPWWLSLQLPQYETKIQTR